MMYLIRRMIHGRRFCTAVPRRAEDIMSNPDCRASKIEVRVWYLLGSGSDIDTAAKYARLAAFSRIKTEDTELTCQYIIRDMLQNKRYKDASDLYDYFFNQHKLKPNSHCCNYMIESRLQQGLVDEALDFHRSIKSGMALDYPSQDTFRILTKGLVQSGRLEQAEAFLQAKEVDSRNHPDHVAYNSVIRGYLDLGNVDKANRVLEEFQFYRSSIALSQIDLYKYSSDDDIICEEYENRVAFLMATFMEYWFKQGKETEAMECYDRSVLANKLTVCAETGNALLKILLKYGKKTHAWALYHEMLDQSELNPLTVKIMVDECFDMGRCSEAIETYNKAIAKRNSLRGTYMITRCCENGMLSVAESLVADSGCVCFGYNAIFKTEILNKTIAKNNFFSGTYIITRWFENGLVSDLPHIGFGFIDNTIFKTMIDAYLKAGRMEDAIKTSNKMIDATLKDVSCLF